MLSILILIVLVGFGLWAVNVLVPMEPKYKTLLNGLAALLLVLYVLYALYSFGVFGQLPHPRLR